ncbi:MAG TPA: o-succinylbenzoate synthase [Bacteroidales bacterium]|nr:o-succinylbenzoate synthase [Bacteroidales bacterium]
MFSANVSKHILRFKTPAGTSKAILTEKLSWIINLYDRSFPEKHGNGECSIIPGLSPESPEEFEILIAEMCENPVDNILSGFSDLNDFPAGRAGLEMAWIDLTVGTEGIYFPSAFTEGKTGIPINGLIWMGSKENMLQQAYEKIDEGFRCIKLKIGALDFQDDLDLLRTLRASFGSHEIEIRVDANGAFKTDEALTKLNQLARFDLHSIEQPIMPGQTEAMAKLCELSPVPVALDEELFTPSADLLKATMLNTIRPQYLVLKPSMLGGFSKCQDWIALAGSMQIGWWITSALESNIGLNAIAQFTSTLDNQNYHGLGTGKLFSNNFPSKLKVEKGQLYFIG